MKIAFPTKPPITDERLWARYDVMAAIQSIYDNPRFTHGGTSTPESGRYLDEIKSIVGKIRN